MMPLKTAVLMPLAVVVALVLAFSGEGQGETPSPVDLGEQGLATTAAPAWLFESVRGSEATARLLSTPLPSVQDARPLGALADSQSADVLAVARQAFGDRVVQRTAGTQEAVWKTGAPVKYLDDYTVVPQGGGRLLVSTAPLRHRNRSGRKVPTDLRLRSTGNAWEPRSAPVETVIGARLSTGVSVDGLSVHFPASAEADPLGQTLGENSVIYPRVAVDTDAVVAAASGGAELFTILRSANSPERQRIEIDVPAGADLLAASDGGARIEAADGTPLFSISAPEAEDMNGRPVPVRMSPSSDGRSLVLDVPHRGRGFAYPLLVDPVVSPWLDGSGNGWWFAGHREGLEQWSVSDGHGSGAAFAPRTTCYTPVSCYATDGLYLYAYAGYTYSAGANTGWVASLPASRTAYFKSVKFVNTYFNRRGDGAPAPFLAAGILNTTNYSWTGLTTTNANLTNATLTIPATMGTISQGKQAWFGMFVDAVRTLPAWEDMYAGGVVMEVEDPESPTITGVTGAGSSTQTGWLRGSTSITPTATDPGLGVWQYAIAIPGLLTPSGGSVGYPQGCTGRIGDECPTSYTRTISWDTAAMPNGSNQISLWAYDASQHLSTARMWTLKIDNELPVASTSGTLSDARGADLDPGVSSTAVHVAATDGTTTTARSGVASIAIAVDGSTVTTTQPCAATQSSCALTADRTVTTSSLASGSHTINVTVTDRAGNVKQDSWQVGLYPTSWQYGGVDHRIKTAQEIANLEAAIAAANSTTSAALYAGLAPGDRVRLDSSRDHTAPDIYEINRPGYWVNDANLLFDFGATDAASGIKTLRTFAPAVPDWQGVGSSHMLNGCVADSGIQCVGNAHVRSVVSNLSSGLQTIEVRAADPNGNERHSQYHLPVDKEAPTMTMDGALWTSASNLTAGDLQVVANDSYSGVTSIQLYERLSDGSRRYVTGAARTNAQCPAYGCTPLGMTFSTVVDVASLGFGSHRFELDVWDRAGNLNTIAWTTSVGYGGANGVVDSDAEILRIIDAMAAKTPSERQTLWAGLTQASRDYYINRLVPDAQLNRRGFGLNTNETAIRSIFSDPTTHGTIARFGAPMTSAEEAYVWDDSPEGTVIEEPVNPDVLASTYENHQEVDDGSLPIDSVTGGQGSGCDPQLDPTCPGDGATLTFSTEGPSDPVTDDLNATAAHIESAQAVQAGAASPSWFDRYGARADANRHALEPRSGLFKPVGDADCTNFVSQVWHLGGGLNMTGRWFIKEGWFVRKSTYSWVLVRNFVDYMLNKRQIVKLKAATPSAAHLPSGTGIADAVEYDWGEGEGWSHLSIVVGLNNNRDDTISQHSTNRRDSTWRRGWLQQSSEAVRANMRARVVHVTVK